MDSSSVVSVVGIYCVVPTQQPDGEPVLPDDDWQGEHDKMVKSRISERDSEAYDPPTSMPPLEYRRMNSANSPLVTRSPPAFTKLALHWSSFSSVNSGPMLTTAALVTWTWTDPTTMISKSIHQKDR
jgi:hypothetical protein